MSDVHKALAKQGEGGTGLHPLVAAAQSSDGKIDTDVLRDLMTLQREYEAGEARRAFTRALVDLKRDLPAVIARDQEVDFTSQKGRTHYRHTSLAAVMDAVTDALTGHGFSLSWVPKTEERIVHVTARLTHAEGHSEEATLSAPPDTSGLKSAAQAIASTITLLQRYSALALLGIATADMGEVHGPRESDPSAVDTARNLRAAAALSRYGKTREEAEQFLEKPCAEWAASDLADLREWVKGAS